MSRIPLLFFFLCVASLVKGQFTFVEDPVDQTYECDDTNGSAQTDNLILNYLQSLEAFELSCPDNAIISWDYTTPIDFNCNDVILIVVTLEDACGTYPMQTYEVQIFIEDTINPVVEENAQDLFIECGDSAYENIIEDWLFNVGDAIYSDACTEAVFLQITNDYNSFEPNCSQSPLSVTFTITDACGNSATTMADIVVTDVQPPYFIAIETNPNAIECEKNELLSNGFGVMINQILEEAQIGDEGGCNHPDELLFIVAPDPNDIRISADQPDLNCPGGTLTGKYYFDVYIEDLCGNQSEVETIEIVVEDNTSPSISFLPADTIVNCTNDIMQAEALLLLDDCEAPPVLLIETFLDEDCPIKLEREWIFEDYCGNFGGSHTQTIRVIDTLVPEWIGDTSLFLPQDITVYIEDCNKRYFFPNGYFESDVIGESWPIFPLTESINYLDNCMDSKFNIIGPPPTEVFEIGMTKITYLVVDNCGQTLSHDFTVNVVCKECYNGVELATESCRTKPNWYYCDMTDMFGVQACTPPDTAQMSVWPYPLKFCNGQGESSNIAWFSFVSSSSELCLMITTLGCRTDAEGLIFGLYDFCKDDNGLCIGGNGICNDSGNMSALFSDLIVGNEYYLAIGGCDGAECTFEINVCENFDLEIDLEAFLINDICIDEVIKFNYFIDDNKNQVQDIGELSLNVNEPFINLSDSTFQRFFSNGQESYVVRPGTYGLEFINGKYSPSNLPDSVIIVKNEGFLTVDVALCINEDEIINDVDIQIVALQLERCNRTIPFRIKVTNIGNTAVYDTLTLNFDSLISSRFIDFVPIVDMPSTLKWKIELPSPQQSQSILVNLKMPSASHTGELFCLYPKFSKSDNDFIDHCFELKCPFDPNDKHGQPHRGGINPILNEEELLYTIRFENLGNDTAFNIRIEDVIKNELDESSIRYIQSSHNLDRYYVNAKGILKFYFDEINLPSIAQDSLLNKGFVQYSISSKSGLPFNTEIKNRASIFFDENNFINTNTTTHTIVERLPEIFVDSDGDGYTSDIDCDDSNANIYPGATEICDALDNDCNGIKDDILLEAPMVYPTVLTEHYVTMEWEIIPNSMSYTASFSINGGITLSYENLIDNHFTITQLSPGDKVLFTVLVHMEGECPNLISEITVCSLEETDMDNDGYHSEEDCDDTNPNIFPGAIELCDYVDNNCDGEIDEGLEFNVYYEDSDNDGYGGDIESIVDCKEPIGYVINNYDCDDTNPNIHPDAIDIPNNGIDENCDGEDLITSIISVKDLQLSIFPNPFYYDLNIYSLKDEKLDYVLLSVDGKVNYTLGPYNILQDLASGFYYIKITDAEGHIYLYPILKY